MYKNLKFLVCLRYYAVGLPNIKQHLLMTLVNKYLRECVM